MDDNRLMGTNEMWEGMESDALHILTLAIQEKIKGMRISELSPETLRKRVGDEATRLMIPRETLLKVTKVIVRQTLNEALSELDKLEFSNPLTISPRKKAVVGVIEPSSLAMIGAE